MLSHHGNDSPALGRSLLDIDLELSPNGREGSIELETINDPSISWRCYTELKIVSFYGLCFLSGGLLYIVSSAYPHIRWYLTTVSCNPEDADFVVRGIEIAAVERAIGGDVQFAELECKRYFANKETGWKIVALPDAPIFFAKKFLSGDTIKCDEIESIKLYYGPNKMALPAKSIFEILLVQLISPFFVFQYFSVILWCYEDYVAFSVVILVITMGAIYTNTREQVFNLKRLHDMAGLSQPVTVLRDGIEVDVWDVELSPGDRIVVREGSPLPCDAVLISGRVVVDESMLTGESAPITKTPFDVSQNEGKDVDVLKHSGHILFSGTKVKKVSQNSVAVVYRTGFRSSKGQLIASLLGSKEDNLGFFSDALYVIAFMFLLASCLYLWASMYLVNLGASSDLIVLKYFDSITIAVPPALTTCLIVATSIAIKRLNERNIFVSETSRVNWAGTVEIACFDKTGTLTSDELKYEAVTLPEDLPGYPPREHALQLCEEVMATCHSLSLVDGKAVGDLLEIELFHASGWRLEDNNSTESNALMFAYRGSNEKLLPRDQSSRTDDKFLLLKHFEFNSDKLRAGTLLQRPTGEMVYLLKGMVVRN